MRTFTFTAIVLLVSVCSVLGQIDNHFQTKYFSIGSDTTQYSTVVQNNAGYALSFERTTNIFSANITAESGSKVDPTSTFVNQKGDTIGQSSSVSVQDTVYSITTSYILAINLTDIQSVFFGYNGSYPMSSIGSFSYQQPGQPNPLIFALSPGNNKVYYFQYKSNVVTGNGPIDIDTPQSIDIPALSQTWGYALDLVNGYLFVGDDSGKISVVNLNTTTVIGTHTPNGNIQRSVGVVDPNLHNLYFCSQNSSQISLDVFNYNTSTAAKPLTEVDSHQINSLVTCSFAAYDDVQGQVFVVGADSSFLSVLGIGHDGGNPASFSFSEGGIEVEAIGVIVHKQTHELMIFTPTRMLQIQYESNCPNDCFASSGQGVCQMGVCQCDINYNGTDCGTKKCLGELNECSGHGFCSNGFCVCDSDYMTVANCSIQGCMKNCSNHGTCNFNPSNPSASTCTCYAEYSGQYCDQSAPAPECSTLETKSVCIDHTYCGWCVSTEECLTGNQYGPVEGFCREWFYDEDVEIGVVVLAAIFIALISILFLVDMITTIPLDIDRAKNYEVEFRTGTYPKASHEEASVLWWRDQRSAKAWTLMDQFQYVSLISHMGVVFPSRFLNFTEYLDWTNLGIPFPQSIRDQIATPIFESRNLYDPSVTTARSLMTYAQYNNILETTSTYHLANILFWFIILAAAFIVPLLLAFIILNFIESLVHWKEVIRNRLIHCTIRILQFSYIGVISAAAFSIVAKPLAAKTIVPGAILIALYGIGFPIAIWFLLKVPESRLHNPTFKQQFGCLYVNFKPKTDHRFVVFSYIKRFIMAMIIGILAFNIEPSYPLSGQAKAVPIAQCIIICLVIVLYVVLLAIRKPYFDHYHLWLEYLLAVLNIVSVGVCLSHLKEPSVAGELVVCVLQALALVACIAAYFISWLQMRSSFLNKISNVLCCCCKGDKVKKNEAELK
ncbi:substrate adhesion molecule [Heterostelium album PN500]|uniref:Substrate adhesion molecule n=1 Tax=Heterostelium pallidum (strain ATCC 26659 / Pp 5 / PN500) TaxID=670386 RepID=D3BA87_HETP5|nr:substrate adhesion molecule [Heterostelium album PN500]EFA81474.1 substrate adhesion molecule [Heterostelium album PN500]|eukprot:XP_020433592.1 substrate adhesion molecule [Heterostelium album PN500]